MSTRLRIPCVGIVLLLVWGHEAGAFLPRDSIELSTEVIANSVEGPPCSRCRVSEEVQTFRKRAWRVAVGEARPHLQKQKASGGTRIGIRCEDDAIEETHTDSASPRGSPYLVAGVSTLGRLVRQMEDERLLEVEVSVSIEKLSGFGEQGEPRYEDRFQLKRQLSFAEDGDALLPLLVAGDAEGETSGIREVFLRISARARAEESGAAYGVVSVSSGMKEAELLLDGGLVGKVSAGGKATLRNVRVGLREVAVRDASGHAVRKVVRVRANRTVLVDLSPLDSADDAVHLRLHTVGKNAEGYEEYRREADGAVVVTIPAGEFLMGNDETEASPLEHRVYVSEFLMDKTGVTWGQYRTFAEATGIPLPPHEPYWGIHDDHPAVYVTWEESAAYCQWAGGRLPTEAEREKAARGTDDRKYPWGDEEPDPERAVFRRTWGYHGTGAVGTHPAGASPYGLQDMGGNVWEWCADWYDDGYYAVSPHRDPKGPPSGRAHVVRGGSWDSRPAVLSCSRRSWGHRGYRDGDFGFRCAMNAPR